MQPAQPALRCSAGTGRPLDLDVARAVPPSLAPPLLPRPLTFRAAALPPRRTPTETRADPPDSLGAVLWSACGYQLPATSDPLLAGAQGPAGTSPKMGAPSYKCMVIAFVFSLLCEPTRRAPHVALVARDESSPAVYAEVWYWKWPETDRARWETALCRMPCVRRYPRSPAAWPAPASLLQRWGRVSCLSSLVWAVTAMDDSHRAT